MRYIQNIIAMSIGVATGSLATVYLVKEYYRGRADAEIASVKETYRRLSTQVEEKAVIAKSVARPDSTWAKKSQDSKDLQTELAKLGYTEDEVEVESDEEVELRVNAFDEFDVHSAIPEKIFSKLEDPEFMVYYSEPHVISQQDFMDLNGHEKITVTFFEEDDILIDEREIPIDGWEDMLGDDAMSKFGEGGSEDKDTVYIRNNALEADYEITRDPRSYEYVVLRIRDKKRVGKMREDDE